MGCEKEVSEAGKKKCNILKIQYKRIPCFQHSMNISVQNTITKLTKDKMPTFVSY